MSWRELHERYHELKDLTEEQLIEKIGPWWGPIFFESKEEIRKTLWRRDEVEKKPIEPEEEPGGCDGKDYCEIE